MLPHSLRLHKIQVNIFESCCTCYLLLLVTCCTSYEHVWSKSSAVFHTPHVHVVFLSCNFKRLIFCKKRLPELKKEKKSHLPLVEIILSAQSFTLLLKSFIATAVVMQAFFCICICICCTDDKKKVPLAAAAAMQGVFVGRGRAGVGKKIAPVLPGQEARGKRQENTGAPKFNPDQCKKVSPRQSRQETLQNKQKWHRKKTDRELFAKVQLE